MMTDPIADMITRIRNCNRRGGRELSLPSSQVKRAVAEALKREGYLSDVEVDRSGHFPVLKLRLTVGPNGERSFNNLTRLSRPGCRVYKGLEALKPVRSGLGNVILSTSKGVISDREAREQKVGGEILFSIQ